MASQCFNCAAYAVVGVSFVVVFMCFGGFVQFGRVCRVGKGGLGQGCVIMGCRSYWEGMLQDLRAAACRAGHPEW